MRATQNYAHRADKLRLQQQDKHTFNSFVSDFHPPARATTQVHQFAFWDAAASSSPDGRLGGVDPYVRIRGESFIWQYEEIDSSFETSVYTCCVLLADCQSPMILTVVCL